MAIKFEKIRPGMILLDIHRHKMGNTTMSEWGCWNVLVVSVDPATRTAMVRWNHNGEQCWSRRMLEKLYVKPTKAYLAQCERRNGGRHP